RKALCNIHAKIAMTSNGAAKFVDRSDRGLRVLLGFSTSGRLSAGPLVFLARGFVTISTRCRSTPQTPPSAQCTNKDESYPGIGSPPRCRGYCRRKSRRLCGLALMPRPATMPGGTALRPPWTRTIPLLRFERCPFSEENHPQEDFSSFT